MDGGRSLSLVSCSGPAELSGHTPSPPSLGAGVGVGSQVGLATPPGACAPTLSTATHFFVAEFV